ncbi:MAG TPA: [protein-PII] uridylyltransferase [Terriglobia bacterium]|nr:[protein-PII] uridylyltransferase [Terriglobia bacterium]
MKDSPEPRSPLSPTSSLPDYAAGVLRIRERFESTGDALTCLRERSSLVDSVVSCLYSAFFSPDLAEPRDFSLVAVGGYGRQELFPFSDVDLLFVSTSQRTLDCFREPIAAFVRALWDLKMRVGHSARTVMECGQLQQDNLEFSISLLDCRHLAGDIHLSENLRGGVIPHLVARDQQDLVRNLVDVTLRRHEKHGNTIFQLEPNIKDAPGGLRDYHVARWLALIQAIVESREWPGTKRLRPPKDQDALDDPWQFLAAIRCFLHHERGRDDNLLTYELQEKASSFGLGGNGAGSSDPAGWMRNYFLRTRSVYRFATRLIEDALYPRSSLYGIFQDWRSRLSNTQFSVIRGRIFPRLPAPGPKDVQTVLSLFEMVARHGLSLSREAETWVEEFLANSRREAGPLQETLGSLSRPQMWPEFRRTLALPNSARALRMMHSTGMLTALFPEFRAIDALVIRDFYHRYTVDEHSFMAIQNVCSLRPDSQNPRGQIEEQALGPWIQRLGALYTELDQPDLLSFALLFHDVGKGMDAPEHVQGSLRAVEEICGRLGLDRPDLETVLFLVGRHLEMGSTITRRDIFDPDTVRSFAEAVGSPERLKMLCLFTYADIKAVNPEALTPWKAEMLWQLFTMTFNYLSRSLDEDRFSVGGPATAKVSRVLSLIKPVDDSVELNAFLDGFPRRYLESHSPEEIAEHFLLARRISEAPVQVRVRRLKNYGELTVATPDRPYLFAFITGTLAAWGMNILKAEAFANRAGITLDILRFYDLHRTLELNPSEVPRLEQNIADVLSGRVQLQQLMTGRVWKRRRSEAKIKVPSQITFDDTASRRSTLLEIVAQDQPGLLYTVSSALADYGCNIEVALVDTEAQKAIDVFYLTAGEHKLGWDLQEVIRMTLLRQLSVAASERSDE